LRQAQRSRAALLFSSVAVILVPAGNLSHGIALTDMVAVQSSAIVRIRYRPKGRELLVTFVNGKTYVYEGVPERIYEAFLAAASHGTFLNAHIRDRYPYRLD
jgi:hypothetical protein